MLEMNSAESKTHHASRLAIGNLVSQVNDQKLPGRVGQVLPNQDLAKSAEGDQPISFKELLQSGLHLSTPPSASGGTVEEPLATAPNALASLTDLADFESLYDQDNAGEVDKFSALPMVLQFVKGSAAQKPSELEQLDAVSTDLPSWQGSAEFKERLAKLVDGYLGDAQGQMKGNALADMADVTSLDEAAQQALATDIQELVENTFGDTPQSAEQWRSLFTENLPAGSMLDDGNIPTQIAEVSETSMVAEPDEQVTEMTSRALAANADPLTASPEQEAVTPAQTTTGLEAQQPVRDETSAATVTMAEQAEAAKVVSESAATTANTSGLPGNTPANAAASSAQASSAETPSRQAQTVHANAADARSQDRQDSRQDSRQESRQELRSDTLSSGGKPAEESAVSKTASSNQQLAQQLSSLMSQGKSTEQMGQEKAVMTQMTQSLLKGVEQQATLRATETMNLTSSFASNGSELDSLSLIEGASSERRGNLPAGLQSIPLPVKHPQWGQALGQRVSYMANAQIQQAQITLNPEKLGPIQIKLHMDRDQQVQVSLSAQHGTTKEAIEAAIPRLREMLEQSGVQVASVDVGDFSQFSEQAGEDLEEESQLSQTAQNNAVGSVDESETTKVDVHSDQLVDYYA